VVTVRQFDDYLESLPEVTVRPSRNGRPNFYVRTKLFAAHRDPRGDALDEDGTRLEDVLMLRTPDEPTKFAMIVERPDLWFTTAHFDGYAAVLTRESWLRRMSRADMVEAVSEAWLAQAPPALARQWLERK
jgi:hypothetical protein